MRRRWNPLPTIAVPLLLMAGALLAESPATRVSQCGVPRPTPGGQTTCLAVSPDGRRIASGAFDGSVWVFATDTGEIVWRRADAHLRLVLALEFSHDGAVLASSSYDPGVRLWDAASGTSVRDLDTETDPICAMRFDPADQALVCASTGGLVQLRSLTSGDVLRTLQLPERGTCRLAISADGARLAAAGQPGDVRVWDLRNGSPLGVYREQGLSALAFTADGGGLLSANARGRLTLWDIEHGQPRWTSWRHRAAILDVGVLGEGGSALSLCEDGWRETSMIDGLPLREASTTHARILGRVDTRSRLLWTSTGSGPIVAEPMDARGPEPACVGHCAEVSCAIFSSDGAVLASGGVDGRVCVWEVSTGRNLLTLAAMDRPVRAIALDPGRRLLALGGKGHGVQIRDVRTGEMLQECLGLWEPTEWVGFDAVRDRVFALGTQGGLMGWTLPPGPVRALTGAEIEESRRDPSRPLAGAVMTVPVVEGISVRADFEARLEIAEEATGMSTLTPPLHVGPARAVLYRPMERTVISAGGDGAVRWTDLRTCEVRASLVTPPVPVRCLAVSDDGRLVALGRADGSLDVWPSPGDAFRPASVEVACPKPEEAWRDLGSELLAWGAALRLAASPRDSLPFLAERLQAARSPWLAGLVARLDSEAPAEREAATEALRARGEEVAPVMERLARESPSPEVRARARMVLDGIPAPDAKTEALRQRRAIVVLVWMETPEAWDLLDRLSSRGADRRFAEEVRRTVRLLAPRRRPAEAFPDPSARAW